MWDAVFTCGAPAKNVSPEVGHMFSLLAALPVQLTEPFYEAKLSIRREKGSTFMINLLGQNCNSAPLAFGQLPQMKFSLVNLFQSCFSSGCAAPTPPTDLGTSHQYSGTQ